MTESNDLVSIGLPAYNGEKYLRRSLDSLVGQTYKNIELVISDDASSDKTQAICEEYAKKDARIRYFRQPKNIGQLENFPFVLKEARGKYFMWAAQDDWWDPRFIEVLAEALNKNPGHGVAMSSYDRIYDDGEFACRVSFAGDNNITNLDYGAVLEMMMKKAPIHKFSYGLFRTPIIKKLISRPFPQSIAWERVYMCEVALAAGFYSHPESLYRITTYRKNLKDRWGHNDVAGPYFNRFHYTKYVFTVIWRLITSPIVPIYRKFIIVPQKSLELLWYGRGRILNELSPATYRLIRRFY